MMGMSERVREYIQQSFTPESITIEEFPLLPGGHLIRDHFGEELLLYWDIEQACIRSQDAKGWTRRETWD